MAENKKSFVLYSDSQGLVNQLPDDVAGRLLKHIYAYVNDENPITDELLLNIAFEPIKMQLKRDLQKWEQTKEGRSVAGKASAEAKRLAKLAEQSSTNSTNVESVEQNSTNSTVNDNDNVNDNVIKENINKPLAFSFYNSLINYGFKKELVSDWLKVRKNKNLTNTETAFNKFIIEVEKVDLDKNKILEECVSSSWGGFKSKWLKDETESNETLPEHLNIDFPALIGIFNRRFRKSNLIDLPQATKKRFLELLKCGYTKEDIGKAIERAYTDELNRDRISLEMFSFASNIDKYKNFQQERL